MMMWWRGSWSWTQKERYCDKWFFSYLCGICGQTPLQCDISGKQPCIKLSSLSLSLLISLSIYLFISIFILIAILNKIIIISEISSASPWAKINLMMVRDTKNITLGWQRYCLGEQDFCEHTCTSETSRKISTTSEHKLSFNFLFSPVLGWAHIWK